MSCFRLEKGHSYKFQEVSQWLLTRCRVKDLLICTNKSTSSTKVKYSNVGPLQYSTPLACGHTLSKDLEIAQLTTGALGLCAVLVVDTLRTAR
ncbi:hypothetical protein M3J09_002107 [Ascochyta lentis]